MTSLNAVRKQRGSLQKKPPTEKSPIVKYKTKNIESLFKEFLVALLLASAASLKLIDLLFAFAFSKK